MELLDLCLKVYFQFKDGFCSQTEGLPMGSSLSPTIANLYMDWLQRRLFDDYMDKPKFGLGTSKTPLLFGNLGKKLVEFFEYLNYLTPCIQFTYALESNNSLPFLDVLVIRNQGSVYSTV